MLHRIRLAACLLASVALAPACAAESLADLLNGSTKELPQRVGDLDASWTRVEITTVPVDRGTMTRLVAAGTENPTALYYTQGRTITAGNVTCLVALRPAPAGLDAQALSKLGESGAGAQGKGVMDLLMPPVTADTPLALALLDVRSIRAMAGPEPYNAARATAERLTPTTKQAMMAAILFPVFAKAREQARVTSSLSNLKQLAVGVLMAAQDRDEVLPPFDSIANARKAIMPYIRNEKLFTRPGTGDAYRPNTRLSRKPLASIDNIADTVLYYEPSPDASGKRCVVILDGHAKHIDEAEWQRVKQVSGIR